MAKQQIRRTTMGQQWQRVASGIFSPGHLVAVDSNGKILKHAVKGGRTPLLIAIEDRLQGKTVNSTGTSAYAVGDPVQHLHLWPGDKFVGRLPANAGAVVIGDHLISNGDGTFVKALVSSGELLSSNVAASAVITNTNVETAFDKSYTIPANALVAGDMLHIRAEVSYPTTNSTDTALLKLKIGSTIILATSAVDVANDDVGILDAYLVIRTVGTAGTLVANGYWSLGVPGTATLRTGELASTTINTTTTQAVTVTQTWSVASTSDIARLDVLTVELSGASAGQTLVYADEAIDNSAGVAEALIDLVAL